MPVLVQGDIDLFKAKALKMEGARTVVTKDQAATFLALVANLTVDLDLAALKALRNHALASTLNVTAASVLRFCRLLRNIQDTIGRL